VTLAEIANWLLDRRAVANAGMIGKKQWVVIFSIDDPANSVQAVHDDREQAMYWAMVTFDLKPEHRILMSGKELIKC
jgi:hypothetical protein